MRDTLRPTTWLLSLVLFLAVLALMPIAFAQGADPLPPAEPFDLTAFLDGIVAAYPKLSALILSMGALRLVLKPIVSAVHWWIANSATKADDAFEEKVVRSPLGKFLWAVINYIASVKPLPLILALLLPALLTGCAIGGGASASRHVVTKNGNDTSEITEKAWTRPWIAWGDAKQVVANQKVSNTKSGNSIGHSGLSQETSASSVAPIIASGGELMGQMARTFMGLPPAAGSADTNTIPTPAK